MTVGEAASHAMTVGEAGGHERQERHLSQRGWGRWGGQEITRGGARCTVG